MRAVPPGTEHRLEHWVTSTAEMPHAALLLNKPNFDYLGLRAVARSVDWRWELFRRLLPDACCLGSRDGMLQPPPPPPHPFRSITSPRYVYRLKQENPLVRRKWPDRTPIKIDHYTYTAIILCRHFKENWAGCKRQHQHEFEQDVSKSPKAKKKVNSIGFFLHHFLPSPMTRSNNAFLYHTLFCRFIHLKNRPPWLSY